MRDDKILQVSPDVQWIGVLDRDIVTFDVVMETKYGTTYNSYFINAEKKTIIDTVKQKYSETYIEKIKKVVDPKEIQYIVCNHTEPDHSGSVGRLLDFAPDAVVVGSGNAIRYLSDIVGKPFKSLVLKDGDILDLGNKKLRIIGAPNLHWPDSIYTYLEEDQLLFTCDSFGAHFCNPEMFDDLVGNFDEAFQYYFDVILKPYSKFMIKAIEKIKPLKINAICTGHGPILRKDWKKYVDISEKEAQDYLLITNNKKKKIFIAYVSAYGSTGEMANQIAAGINEVQGVEVETLNIESTPIGEIESKIGGASSILVGSLIINQNILLPIYKLFSVINPIRDKGKIGGAFGSYGWSGEAVKIIEDNLRNLKLKVPVPGISVKFFPFEDSEKDLKDFGRKIAIEVLKECVEN